MSKWIQVFRGKQRRKDQERWACKGCGQTFEGNHNTHPVNGVCQCAECKGHLSNSELYRRNYDLINWTTKAEEKLKENNVPPTKDGFIVMTKESEFIHIDEYIENLSAINQEIGSIMGISHAT